MTGLLFLGVAYKIVRDVGRERAGSIRPTMSSDSDGTPVSHQNLAETHKIDVRVKCAVTGGPIRCPIVAKLLQKFFKQKQAYLHHS